MLKNENCYFKLKMKPTKSVFKTKTAIGINQNQKYNFQKSMFENRN